jgi:hypothetical protein
MNDKETPEDRAARKDEELSEHIRHVEESVEWMRRQPWCTQEEYRERAGK